MIENLTLAEIVKTKPEAAKLMEKYDLDFCCKGKMKLSDQVKDSVLLDKISNELEALFLKTEPTETDFESYSFHQLVDFIVEKHHAYVKESMPVILEHLEKVAYKHGDAFPYMKRIASLFFQVKTEMEQHMIKEESVLFPAILDMEKQAGSNEFLKQGFSVDAPIQMMEAEHEMAGKIMDEIRQLSNHYTIPDAACTTFAVSLKELKLFEEDLHRHVHLENYVLFPKAIAFQEKGKTEISI